MASVQKTVRDIKSLKIQGATKIRKEAVKALLKASLKSKAKTEKQFRKEFSKNAKALFYSRETEPALRTGIRILLKSIAKKGLSAEEMKEALRKTVKDYEAERQKSLKNIASYGAELIKPGSTILTLCHSHSVVDIIIKAKRKVKQVYCCETRPLYQGRITAKELSKAGLKVTLIVDNAASTVLKKCDYFLTGADAFLADGDVVNKIGTNQISTACKRYATKHYVACSTHKFEPASIFGKEEPIEERDPKEIWEKSLRKIKIMNPAFDRTDSSFIEGIVCELGVFPPEALAAEMYDLLKAQKIEKEFMRLK